jgi:hypothetical protein
VNDYDGPFHLRIQIVNREGKEVDAMQMQIPLIHFNNDHWIAAINALYFLIQRNLFRMQIGMDSHVSGREEAPF